MVEWRVGAPPAGGNESEDCGRRPGSLGKQRGGWTESAPDRSPHPQPCSPPRSSSSSLPRSTCSWRTFSHCMPSILSALQTTSMNHLEKTWEEVSRWAGLSHKRTRGVRYLPHLSLPFSQLEPPETWGQGLGWWGGFSLPENLAHQYCFRTQFP